MAVKFKSFAQPDLLKRIQLENLIRLLEPHRLFFELTCFSVPDSPETEIDYLASAVILAQPDEEMSSDLVEALHVIGTLSGDDNFDILLDLAHRHGLVVEAEATAPDLATRLYLHDPDLHDPEILERKQRERLFETRKTFECYRAASGSSALRWTTTGSSGRWKRPFRRPASCRATRARPHASGATSPQDRGGGRSDLPQGMNRSVLLECGQAGEPHDNTL